MLGDYKRAVLENGLCVIGVENPALHYFVCNARAHAGPRFEPREHAGLTHFLEHMIMQGSKNYPTSNALMRAVEDLGGVIDGETSLESVEITLGIHRKHCRKGLEILTDVLLHPLFDEQEIEQEKAIVAQEIGEYRDERGRNISASELAYGLLFKEDLDDRGTRGDVPTLQSFNRELVHGYYERFFTPENMVISVAGAFEFGEVFDALAQSLGNMPPGREIPQILCKEVHRRRPRAIYRMTERLPVVDIELCHHAYSLGDDRFNATRVAAHILGGGLSSRLFTEVREVRGLVYSIMSFIEGFSDAGSVVTSLGVDRRNLVEAAEATLDVVRRFRDEGIQAEELERYKETVRCGMEIMCDRPLHLADWFGKQELLLRPEKLVTPVEYIARQEALTAAEIHGVMNDVFADAGGNLVGVGPFGEAEREKLRGLFPAEDVELLSPSA